MDWLRAQWNDIKGNAKWWLVTIIGAGVVFGVIALTHGMSALQQAVLAAGFVYLFLWATVATWGKRRSAIPKPAIEEYTGVASATISVGEYRTIDFGHRPYFDSICIELLEITKAKKPKTSYSSEEGPRRADLRCVRVRVEGLTAAVGESAIRKPGDYFEFTLFEDKENPLMHDSIIYDFRLRREGFALVAVTVEHIKTEARTAELRVFGVDRFP